ncbi:hypothetical protein FRC03_005873, partial [Tulasnella sp. 419]
MKSRRFPFASLDKRIRDLAWLDHLKKTYGLTKTLDLSKRRKVEECGTQVPGYKHDVILIRRKLPITNTLRERIGNHLGNVYSVEPEIIRELLPDVLETYSKLQRLEGGDMMHASQVVANGPFSHDMTWVK